MSESYEPPPTDGADSPPPGPAGTPPKTGGDLHRPGARDTVDAEDNKTGNRGEDTGGMLGEG